MLEPVTVPVDPSARARQRLEELVARGAAQADALIARVESEIPEDAIVKMPAALFVNQQKGEESRLEVLLGSGGFRPIHKHALQQVAEISDLPWGDFVSRRLGTAWEREMLARCFSEIWRHANGRKLFRSVAGTVRGVLSDSYRRLDSRPILDAVVNAAREIGAVPSEGAISDVRVSLRVILPRVYEPVPGEFMVFGGAWNNSDFGAGANNFSLFCVRLLCLNGLVGESLMRQVHLGRRLDENMVFSRRTYELDTAATASSMRDAVKAHLAPAAVDAYLERVRRAATEEVDGAGLRERFRKALTKTEATAVIDLFNTPDVEYLPPGQTTWRAAQAVSRFAQQVPDATRRMELETYAGSLLPKAA